MKEYISYIDAIDDVSMETDALNMEDALRKLNKMNCEQLYLFQFY